MTFRIEKLRRGHRVEGFDCGKEPLNRFLIRFALQSQLSNSSQTYLAFSQDEVVGFYKAFGDVTYEDAPERLRKGVARHPIPLMILARLWSPYASITASVVTAHQRDTDLVLLGSLQ
jgi:hypothetical protein